MNSTQFSDAQLVFIGVSNWDYYVNSKGDLISKPKPNNDASTSHFGTKSHIAHLFNTSGFEFESCTNEGLDHFEGMHTGMLFRHDKPPIVLGVRF